MEWIETKDGCRLAVRSIRPSDSDALEAAFKKLSADTRYRRFLHPLNRLAPGELEYLTRVDHVAHEALIALDPEGNVVGVARFIRKDTHSVQAEVAITVADEWQARGVGTQLLRRLASRARQLGIQTFTAICLGDNEEMLQLFRELGATTTHCSGSTSDVEVEVELPIDSPAPVFRAALKAAATSSAGYVVAT